MNNLLDAIIAAKLAGGSGGGGGEVTPASIVTATGQMTPQQASETRENIGATDALTSIPDDVKQALLNCLAHVAWTDEHGQDYVDDLEAALYPSSGLVGIAALYTQSGTVYDTDTIDSLKDDLVVTATYANGDVRTVADYTLSGTLTVGTSTITVSYGGKTTTFDVTVTECVPQGWLYHFADTLASSGTKDFNFTGVAAYGTGPTGRGKAFYHHVGTEGDASTDPLGIYATGLTDIPDLSGDFTIAFWAKAVTATSSHPLVANKYYSDNQATSEQPLPSNVVDGWIVGRGGNTSLKYRGIRFIYISERLVITLNATDNSVVDYQHTLPSGTVLTNWHHYALTRKNGVLRFFFDGALIWSINYTKAIVFPDQICLGNNWGTTAATATQPTQNSVSDYVDDLYIAEFCKWDAEFDPTAITY